VDVTATINHPSKRSSRLLTALYRLSKSLIMDPIVPPSRSHFWRKSDIHVDGGFRGHDANALRME
jgi:hypothetical protein